METHVTLRYPGGRHYETSLKGELQVGDELLLYGRVWTAVGTSQDRHERNGVLRIVCVPSESSGQPTNHR